MDIRTTTELRALRQLLGLSLAEAGRLLRQDKNTLEQAEKGRNWSIPVRYRNALLQWEDHAQALIEEVHESEDTFVLVYTHDEVYREFEPAWSQRIPTALMHLAAASRAKAELPDEELILVMMVPTSYEKYLARDPDGHVFPDNRESRQMWAAAYCKNYRVLEEVK